MGMTELNFSNLAPEKRRGRKRTGYPTATVAVVPALRARLDREADRRDVSLRRLVHDILDAHLPE